MPPPKTKAQTITNSNTLTASSQKPETDEYENDAPVRTLVHSWLFYIMLPAAIIAWSCTKRWTAVVGAALSVPFAAILQGALGILSYRIYFRDAPIPISPSHGVVVVHPEKVLEQDGTRKAPLLDLSGGACSSDAEFLERAEQAQEPPLRLLVIGDSLAIGVGQSEQGFPVMPEVISKTLSKLMNGRVVYWTCHGAPGASAGWIVRELERGVDYLKQNQTDDDNDDSDDESVDVCTDAAELESLPGCSETDESSSDDSSTEDVYVSSGMTRDTDAATTSASTTSTGKSKRMSRKVWRQRLAQHRKRFDPEFLGPYDIAVVLTGSNDLKSAFFPFLLTGEDAEFRRQAVARGGSYAKELRILLETLNSKMQMRLKNLRYSAFVATETVRERVEETIERLVLAPGTSSTGSRSTHRRQHERESVENKATMGARNRLGDEHEHDRDDLFDHAESRHFPLVVLPGMPARALPKFQKLPLRWLAVPVVDIMDMHKRNLAKSHPGQVLFVPAPSLEDIEKYENETGDIWKQRCSEDTALSVRDIRSRDRHRIEGEMRKYYKGKVHSPDDRQAGWMSPFSFIRPHAPGHKIFSIDRIHPNDHGYDFWGRCIANSIFDEWQKKE
jgi:hypothetical protein